MSVQNWGTPNTRDAETGCVFYWPDCATTGCSHKVCTWGSESLCFPCEEKIVGTEEMHRRYGLTHERPWSAPSIEGQPNSMLKTYAQIADE